MEGILIDVSKPGSGGSGPTPCRLTRGTAVVSTGTKIKLLSPEGKALASTAGDDRVTQSGPPQDSHTESRARNGVGVAALVFGVVSLVLAILVLFFPIAAVLGLIAIILGIIGMRRASRGEATNRGQALAGLITGLLAIAIAVFLTVRIGVFLTDHQDDLRRFGSCITSSTDRQDFRRCARSLSEEVDR